MYQYAWNPHVTTQPTHWYTYHINSTLLTHPCLYHTATQRPTPQRRNTATKNAADTSKHTKQTQQQHNSNNGGTNEQTHHKRRTSNQTSTIQCLAKVSSKCVRQHPLLIRDSGVTFIHTTDVHLVFTHCHSLTVTHSLTHCQSQCSTRDRNSNSPVAYMAIQGLNNALNPPTEPSMKLQCVAICTANLQRSTFIVETL